MGIASRWTRIAKSTVFRYGLAIVVTAVALWVRRALDPYLGDYTPYTTLYAGVAVLSIYAGIGPTILSSLLGLAGALYWFAPPRNTFVFWSDPAHMVSVLAYLVVCAFIAAAGELSRRRKAQLEAAQILFNTFLDNSPGMEFLKDASTGTYVYVNQTARARFLKDPVGRTDFDLYPRNLAAKFREQEFQVIWQNKASEFSNTTEEADGEHTWLTLKFPVVDAQGRKLLGGKTIDITERKRVEAERAQLAAIVESSEDAIYAYDFSGVVQTWNRGAEKLYDWTANEVLGRSISTMVPPEKVDEVREYIIPRVQRGETVISYETVRKRRDGGVFNALLTASPMRDASGQPVAVSIIVRDISEMKRTASALKDASAQLRRLIDTAPTGLTRCSRDLRYLSANPAYAKIAGLPLEQIVGRSIVDVMGREAWETIRPHVERVLQGERVEYETFVPFSNSSPRHLHVVYIPERDEQQQVVGWVASVTDVTDFKELQERLRQIEQESEEAPQVRSDS